MREGGSRRCGLRDARHLRAETGDKRSSRRRLLAGLGCVVAIAVATGWTGRAAALTIDLPGNAERTTVTYSCRTSENAEPTALPVEYINLPGSSFAILPLDGQPTLFVNVVAGSGAQYVSGRSVWWTKGPGARLYDATAEDQRGATICEVER